MSIHMATTRIDPAKTAGEISQLLARAGADSVLTKYDGGEAVGVSFAINIKGKAMAFSLPIRWQPVLIAMQNDRGTPRHLCNEDQSRKTAWRIVLRWVQAQLALIDTGSVEIAEVFLPYVRNENGKTLYDSLKDNGFKQLSAPRNADA